MLKPHLSLVVLVHLAAAAAVSGQTSYVFQLPRSVPSGITPKITAVGDNDASRTVSSASSAALIGASKVIATPNGSTFYILTPNGVLAANSTLSTLTPLSAISGAATDAQVSPDGRYLFVAAGHLYIVNTTTGALAANVDTGLPPGATPLAITFSHDSKTAWILSNTNTNTASTITSMDLGTLLASATQLNLPANASSMVLSPGNLLYVMTSGSRIYEIDPLKLAITTLGSIDVPGTGVPGPLQFTPDGANAYFVNLVGCPLCSPIFKLNVQSHAITSWLPSDGSAPPVLDQVLVAGNSRVFAWSSALTQLWDISPSSVAVTPAVIGSGFLKTNTVLAAAVSNEIPSARFLYLLYPDLSFDRITLADNNAAQQSRLDLANGSLLQFVSIPAQTSTAIPPLSLSLVNASQTLAPSAPTVLTGQVVDSAGRPVMGASAVFSADVASGIGITTTSVTTTAGGWAETAALAPAAPGNYTVTLCSPSCGSGGLSGNFSLTVSNIVSGGSAQMFIYEGDGQLLNQGQSTVQTGVPLTVKITDASGNPLAGVPVTFQINSGGIGFLPNTQSQIITDQFGLAKTDYVSANILSNDHFFLSKVHANSVYGDLDFFEITYVSSNALPAPYTTPKNDSRTIPVPQGGVGSIPIVTQTFTGDNQSIPNVGLRLIDDPSNPTPNSAVASCVGSSRADNNGVSTCIVHAICQPNVSLPHDFAIFLRVGELNPFRYTIRMTQGVATSLRPVSLLNQSGNPGNSFTLTAQVTDGCGQPIAASGLTWGILQGSAPALLVNPSGSSDTGGNLTTGVTLGQTAGVVRIQLSGSGLAPITFSITNQIILTSIAVVPPLPPSVTVGQQFQPLTFVVGNANHVPVAGVPVTFSVTTGSATLSPLSANTNAQGLVQTTVTAGATAGNIVVTATAGGLSATATLSSHVPGPALTNKSFTNAVSGTVGMTPCGLVTVTGNGVAPGVQGVVAAASFFGAYPYTLAGLSITVNNTPAPIQSVANDQLGQHATFQAPCDLTGSTDGTQGVTVVVSANGADTTVNAVPVFPFQPGIFTSAGSNGKIYGAVIREVDGTYVTAANPARPGEKIYVVVTGLGQTTPTLITNSAGTGSQSVNVPLAVFLGVDGAHLNGANALSAHYLFGSIGSYLVEFQLPKDAPTGTDQQLLVVALINNGNDFVLGNTVLIPAVGTP
ncbi:MAG TPA: hypothetical protein VGQ49_05420 [Bryobacteraceae bacterium]|jgi:uncharacterized protein (TIGR03437 family)|nr:hypothetical protein [Bryobacteraceae bacterium]